MNSKTRTLRLLIVDDSSIVRTQIAHFNGVKEIHVVGSAANGEDAVRQFRNLLPDLVTLDITMPQMDGIECISQMLAIKPDARILIISALADKLVALDAIRRGAQGFILKPINEIKLNDALTELIRD